MIRVWDPLVRAFHWGLVALFALAWLTADGGGAWHEAAGYAAVGLTGLRLIWGLIGTRYARFSQFIRGPAAVAQYLRGMLRGRERRYLGHNPAGAAMIVAILLTMSATAFTGWLTAEPTRLASLPAMPQFVTSAFADGHDHRKGGDRALKEVHETLADLMLVLIGLHVGGVVFASVRHKENLTRAMITGDKRRPEPGDIA
jgi:cytochrome b